MTSSSQKKSRGFGQQSGRFLDTGEDDSEFIPPYDGNTSPFTSTPPDFGSRHPSVALFAASHLIGGVLGRRISDKTAQAAVRHRQLRLSLQSSDIMATVERRRLPSFGNIKALAYNINPSVERKSTAGLTDQSIPPKSLTTSKFHEILAANDFAAGEASSRPNYLMNCMAKPGSKEHDQLMIELKAEEAATKLNSNPDLEGNEAFDDVTNAMNGRESSIDIRIEGEATVTFRDDYKYGANNDVSSPLPTEDSSTKVSSTKNKRPSQSAQAGNKNNASGRQSTGGSRSAKKHDFLYNLQASEPTDQYDTDETKEMARQRSDLYERYGLVSWRVGSMLPISNPMEPVVRLARESTVSAILVGFDMEDEEISGPGRAGLERRAKTAMARLAANSKQPRSSSSASITAPSPSLLSKVNSKDRLKSAFNRNNGQNEARPPSQTDNRNKTPQLKL